MNRNYYRTESLSQDAIHGYIPFSSNDRATESETSSERALIDSPWLQRLRRIHQLQTAWLVYPTAEHSRFQHVMGAMFLASRVWKQLAPGFFAIFEDHPEMAQGQDVPSYAYIESLLRIAGLLHDVGHGPFGHFFDAGFLSRFRTKSGGILTHETLGAQIIQEELADLIQGTRRNPDGVLAANETLSPEQVAFLIVRPRENDTIAGKEPPIWLRLLRGLFSGLYTVDNMDFVLRDAYMAGYSQKAFDIDRLIHYSFFTEQGLTIHRKGLASLVQFLNIRGDLFRTIYFHRKVRAIDITLKDLFEKSGSLLFPAGNPVEHLSEYCRLTEWSLLTDVSQWADSSDPQKRALASDWDDFLERRIRWRLLAEKQLLFRPGDRESSSVFANEAIFETAFRDELPESLRHLTLRFDIARHFHRPGSFVSDGRQNFLFDPATGTLSNLESEDHYRSIPRSFRICRVYGEDTDHQREIAAALVRLASPDVGDDLTNM